MFVLFLAPGFIKCIFSSPYELKTSNVKRKRSKIKYYRKKKKTEETIKNSSIEK